MPRSAIPAFGHRAACRAGAAALAGCLVLSASGCSGDDEKKEPAGGGESSAAAAQPEVATQATVGETVGRLPADDRRGTARAVARVVDGWWDGAYLGEFPRGRTAGTFDGFSDRARAGARRDTKLLSNLALGRRLTGVEAVSRRVAVDVLAVGQRPVAATARVTLVMQLAGEGLDRRDRLSGRVLLTREKGAWRIFGYDLRREIVK